MFAHAHLSSAEVTAQFLHNVAKVTVPDEAELQARAARIKPVVKKDGVLFLVTNTDDLDSPAFYTDPQLGDATPQKLDTVNYRCLMRHLVSDADRFQPTLREILAQIPPEQLERTSFIEVAGKIRCVDGYERTQYWGGEITLYGYPRIPEISNSVLAQRAARIKPLVRKGNHLWHIEAPKDLRGIAYMWEPKVTKRATSLQELGRCTTFHTWAYYGAFKPTIAEVLAQVPAHLLETTTAFELVDGPETADDLNREYQALNEGYHVATVIFYGPKPVKAKV